MPHYVVSDRYGPLTVLKDKEEARRIVDASPQLEFHEVGWLRATLLTRKIDSMKRGTQSMAESYNRGR